MTPKEKAKELFDKMYMVDDPMGNYPMCFDTAKRCALICYEEMIKEPRMFDSEQVIYSDGSYARSYYEVPNKFWQQVKNEIEKL
jgi:hypothetical protein